MKRQRASERVRAEWLRRIEAEYRSAAVTQHLTLWLIQIGASPDLVSAGLRIVRDELAHAKASHRVFVAGGGEGGPRMPRDTLELPRTPGAPLEDDVARACLEVFCLGETVAVRLFRDLRAACEVPIARRVLDRILRDEVRHRDFGWALLGWLLELPGQGERLRSLATREVPAMLERIAASYAPSEAASQTGLPREDTRWGLMPPARYGQVLRMALGRDYAPRFVRLGIGMPQGRGPT